MALTRVPIVMLSPGQMVVDTFTGDGTTTVFTLSADPVSKNNTWVEMDGVYQAKSQYSYNSATLQITFTVAPPTGSGIEVVSGLASPIASITDLSVTTAKLADGAVTTVKIADANVTGAKLANDIISVKTQLTTPASTLKLMVDSGGVVKYMTFADLLKELGAVNPAFSVFTNAATTAVASSYTKLPFNIENFDTNSNFDAVTNHRFQPTVPGKYLICLTCAVTAVQAGKGVYAALQKNGSLYIQTPVWTGAINAVGATVSCVIDFNGSTDYVDFYIYNGDTANQTLDTASYSTCASGVRVA